MRLIDEGALVERLQRAGLASVSVIDAIGKTPTADPFKHERWVLKRVSFTQAHWECSGCGHVDQKRPGFCAGCGAKMDLEEKPSVEPTRPAWDPDRAEHYMDVYVPCVERTLPFFINKGEPYGYAYSAPILDTEEQGGVRYYRYDMDEGTVEEGVVFSIDAETIRERGWDISKLPMPRD